MKFPTTLSLSLTMILSLGALNAFAQNATGPVHYPAPTAASPVQFPTQGGATPTAGPLTNAMTNAAPAPAASAVTAGDIHDIRGPISIPYEWLWALYLLSGAAFVVAAYALWKLFLRNARVKPKTPFELALERLEAARLLMTPETVREYAFTVSEIVRGYIEQRFAEKAAHRTTEEFLSDLVRQTGTPLAQHRGRLEDFLSHCDLIKFARWQLSAGEIEAMQESARAFILDTRPEPEAAKSRDAAPGTASTVTAQPELLEAK